MRRWLLSVVALVVATMVTTAVPAGASNSWNNYHWNRATSSTVLRLAILDSVTSAWDASLSQSNADWNRSTVFENTVSASDTSTTTRRSCPASTGRVRACNYTYGQNGWRGLAQINLAGGHIAWGTTKVNDSYSWTSAARRHVMCQEIGHDFGLDHQFTNAGSCMDYAGIDDPAYVSPNTHDYNQLASMYNHGHGTAAAASGPSTTAIVTGDTVTSVLWTD